MAAETKKSRKKSKGGNSITNGFDAVRTYLGEVRTELNKVTWPDREDVVRLTRIVLLVTIVSSLVLGALSVLYTEFMSVGFNFPLLFVVLFVIITGVTVYMFQRDSQKTSY